MPFGDGSISVRGKDGTTAFTAVRPHRPGDSGQLKFQLPRSGDGLRDQGNLPHGKLNRLLVLTDASGKAIPNVYGVKEKPCSRALT